MALEAQITAKLELKLKKAGNSCSSDQKHSLSTVSWG